MENLIQTTKILLERMWFSDVGVEAEPEGKKLRIFINEGEWIKEWIPRLIADLEHILRLTARKEYGIATEPESVEGRGFIFVDVNNYRKERERLIVEIAKAAARKASLTKGAISLPAMNAYERRLVHTELATRPDVKTESISEGQERHVIVKPI